MKRYCEIDIGRDLDIIEIGRPRNSHEWLGPFSIVFSDYLVRLVDLNAVGYWRPLKDDPLSDLDTSFNKNLR